MSTDRYVRAAHRVQSAIMVLMAFDRRYTEPKKLRTGIDLTKADMGGLTTLLIAKGVFTAAEYTEALETSAEREADDYEKSVQAVLGNRNIKLG